MKQKMLILILTITCSFSYAQTEEVTKLVEEGVNYHDKGDFEGAISKYDKALELDKDNFYALSEKAFSLLSLQKFEEAILICQKVIEIHPNVKELETVYVTYGNSLDGLKRTDKSIEIYNEGIALFPNYYQLYFNKGVSLASVKKYNEAILCFQSAVKINPKHASSHNGIARLSNVDVKRIPALLAYFRFLAIEPQSKRAKENLESMILLMNGNVEETGKKSVTININPAMLGDTTADGKPNENSFTTTDFILSMDSALDYDKKNKKKSDVEKFLRKFETICASLEELKDANYGFFWEYYVPYFIEMKNKNLLETFAHIAFASGEFEDNKKWLDSHKSEIEKFYEWSRSFEWKTN